MKGKLDEYDRVGCMRMIMGVGRGERKKGFSRERPYFLPLCNTVFHGHIVQCARRLFAFIDYSFWAFIPALRNSYWIVAMLMSAAMHSNLACIVS